MTEKTPEEKFEENRKKAQEAYAQMKAGKAFNLNDTEELERAKALINKKLKETEDAKIGKEAVEAMRSKIREKYAMLGHTCPTLETSEDMDSAVEIYKSLEEKQMKINRLEGEREVPSGSAPLNEAQIQTRSVRLETGFDSTEEMLKDLRRRQHSEDETEKEEADRIIDALWGKTKEALRKNTKLKEEINSYDPNPTSEKGSPDDVKIVLIGDKVEKEEPESELEKFNVKTNKKRRGKHCFEHQ